jgi:glycosyltransferase involved in cell wall biosynthesis
MTVNLVSVIVTCYNKAKYLPPMLDSIILQNYANAEVIVVDDGSSDDSPRILDDYREKFQERGFPYYVIKQENKGLSKAVGIGLAEAKGEYVCFCDADDLLDKEYISLPVDYLNNHSDTQFVLFGIDTFRGDCDFAVIDDTFDLSLKTYSLSAFCSSICKIMIRRKLIVEKSLPALLQYDIQWQEPQVWIPLIAGRYKYGQINNVLYHYRLDAQSSNCKVINKIDFYRGVLSVFKNILHENGIYTDANLRMTEYKLLDFLYAQYPELSVKRSIEILLADGFKFNADALYDVFIHYNRLKTQMLKTLYGIRKPAGFAGYKRVIAYGVLGKQGKLYLDMFKRSFYKPNECWDLKGDGENVLKPDFSKLHKDDLVVVFPININVDFSPAFTVDVCDLLSDLYVKELFEL